MSFQEILNTYKEKSQNERDKGSRFEQLMKRYLLSDPLYANNLSEVWLWNEFPYKDNFGGVDLGIDLVAFTNDEEYWAIQCKFYDEKTNINVDDVSHFIANANRTFKDANNNTVGFSLCLWIDTKKNFGKNAEQLIKNQKIEFNRIGFTKLSKADVDWQKLAKGESGQAVLLAKKEPRAHQQKAINLAREYFKTHDRGKLIMACGTGKTYTALKIVEQTTKNNGFALFLVPSIALLSQTLKAWSADSITRIYPICICSDASSSKVNKTDDTTIDLPFPATTDVETAIRQYHYQRKQQLSRGGGIVTVFSTYQSIDIVHKLQQYLLHNKPNVEYSANHTPLLSVANETINESKIFDIIVCDEAHRTTGIQTKNTDDSNFIKVHDNKFLVAKHRLYMTATPRIYAEEAKKKALQSYTELKSIYSMNNTKYYGEEIYRLGFSEAVAKNLLSDYKVMVLTIGEDQIPPALQNAMSNSTLEISTDDASKLIGCINALSKRMSTESMNLKEVDPNFMHTALAFCSNIKNSKKVTEIFNTYASEYYNSLPEDKQQTTVEISAQHVDGSMSAMEREDKLSWLKDTDTSDKDCHILTNVRCLSEGVDVPALDAIIFLSSRNSQVDIVQSVGRVMRKAKDKKYGYIIVPVVVPTNVKPEVALDSSKDFSIIWSVLNALRAHDDRFNATINKIELNKTRPDQILVGGVPSDETYGLKDATGEQVREKIPQYAQTTLYFAELQDAIYARMVKKVGTKRYWEDWAKNIAEIARRHKDRIEKLITDGGKHEQAFNQFLDGLHKNINPHIKQADAVDMLAQHLITQPVFEALFENYSFVKNNPISKSMNKILQLLDEQGFENDRETLNRFYNDVKTGCEGVDNAEGKQKIIIELYDKFFKLALPTTVSKLGIVYTPVEVVDFILNSVNDILKKEFNRKGGLSEENIHILDPFTGTGTFIVRLLQLGLIKPQDLVRKYTSELHANEIVLLAYYIASINIENTFHDIAKQNGYTAFDGICLTDTFQLGERLIKNEKGIAGDGFGDIYSDIFPANSQRVIDQKKTPMQVIIGNPPYSIGQRSANDNAQNETYPKLEKRLEDTYVKYSTANLNKSIYDSYVKAFRWASDNLAPTGGIIAFVSNAGWLNGTAMDGMRKCLEEEFSTIYVFNLRGNTRTQGETARREGGQIFGSGSRTPIAITILVKNLAISKAKADIYYYDIGDYLSRKEKLQIIADLKSCIGKKFSADIKIIKPNKDGDWINQGNDLFKNYIAIEPNKKFNTEAKSFFITNAIGVATNRDSWTYNYSFNKLLLNMNSMINFYNQECNRYLSALKENVAIDIKNFTRNDTKKISWSASLKNSLKRKIQYKLNKNDVVCGIYRPFQKNILYYSEGMIERPGIFNKLFPTNTHKNLLICVSCVSSDKDLSVLISDKVSDLHFVGDTQCFPLYYYEKQEQLEQSLFGKDETKYVRHDGVTDFILTKAQRAYGNDVTKEDIFYYIYGFLHLPKYRIMFAADLKKSLPRIMLVDKAEDFWRISRVGRDLADLHLDYEQQSPPEGVVVEGDKGNYLVTKLKFLKKEQRDTIVYNNDITIKNIPLKVYDYVVNGRSPVEWIMDRYQVKVDKKSGIENNPNDWAIEHNKPRYILDLLLSVMTVSLKTQEIIATLPDIEFK